MRVHLSILEDRFGASYSKQMRSILVAAAALTGVFGIAGCDRFSGPDSSIRADSKETPAPAVSSEERDFHTGDSPGEHHRRMDPQTGDPDHHESDSSDERD